MEDTTVLDRADYGGATKEIRLTNESLSHLKETAKWGAFLAIMGFIGIGIMILIGIGLGLFMSELIFPGMESIGGAVSLAFFYIILGVTYIYPTLMLFNFASKCKKAEAQSSTDLMTEAFGDLKSCIKFIGIIIASILVLYGLIVAYGTIEATFS